MLVRRLKSCRFDSNTLVNQLVNFESNYTLIVFVLFSFVGTNDIVITVSIKAKFFHKLPQHFIENYREEGNSFWIS